MGILDPSKGDHDPTKKPRFNQDLAVVIIVLGGAILYFIIDWIF